MPKHENMPLGQFLNLVPEEQQMRLMFAGLMVEGTQDAVSTIANSDVNNMAVVNVEAEEGFLKVWVKDENA